MFLKDLKDLSTGLTSVLFSLAHLEEQSKNLIEEYADKIHHTQPHLLEQEIFDIYFTQSYLIRTFINPNY